MNFGAEFDDEIFEKPKSKNNELLPVRQGAKICKPEWFLEENVANKDDPEEVLKCLKYKADYLYFSQNYQEACAIYNKIMTILPSANITGRRECMENLIRCYLKQNCPEMALEWALKMHAVAVSADQKLSSWNLLAVVCHRLKKYEEELEALHCCLEAHKNLPDLWMRIAYCYSGLFKIGLPGSDTSVIASEPYCCSFKCRISVANVASTSSNIESMCHSLNGLSLNKCNISSLSEQSRPKSPTTNQSNRSCDFSMCSSTDNSEKDCICSNTPIENKQILEDNILKCEMCDLATQMISACLIRTRLLLTNTDRSPFYELKNSAMNKKISECLSYLEVDQLFIEEASKMLKNEIFCGHMQPVEKHNPSSKTLCSDAKKTDE